MKIINKKFIVGLLACAVAICLLLVLGACVTTPIIPENGNNVTVTSRGAEVKWNKVDGAVAYDVYYCPSRFGNYEFVQTQTDCSYVGEDIYGYYRVVAKSDNDEISASVYSYEIDLLGANTRIYAPTDDQSAIQEDIDRFKDSTSQFGQGRFAALFKEGKYNDLDLQMRYYMTFAGLSELPTDVEIGNFYVNGELSGGNSTCNFWCGIENMTVNNNVQWAVSQATSFRRMYVNGNLILHDARPGSNTPWASGGFISDTVVKGTIDGSVQQQWFIRNSNWNKWSGGDINMVFAGCSGKLSNYEWGNYGNGWVTYLDTTKVMSEKPYLIFEDGYYVCVPKLNNNSKGVSWQNNTANYYDESNYIPIEEFYVARADRDNAKTINTALKEGKHVLFTPGIYSIETPLLVENPNTILMGIGLATLKNTDANTRAIMRVSDVDGVRINGLMFDAGTYAETLLELGAEKTSVSHADNPVVLNDVFFRIGGASAGNTFVDKTLIINSNNVVGDNFWVWRADHGNGVGWNVNRANNGVIVNGDDVTIYGLMVEHFQQYQTVWNGENGFMAFYQSETPYDPEDQADWMSEWNGQVYEGYASYKVSDTVHSHTAYGLGVYYVASSRLHNVFNLDHAIELPSNEGISVTHMATANFLSYGDKKTNGGIRYIVNGYGKSNFDGSRNHWQSFVAGTATP